MNKKKTITTASRKQKGRLLQKLICQKISELLNIPCGKDELISSREMGQSGVDVKIMGEARLQFPFSIECKNQETWNVLAWIKQAKENQKEGTDWLLFCKKNNITPVVIMDAETFFKIYRLSRPVRE